MIQKMKLLFALLITAMILLSGCSNPPARERLLQIKEAKEFLEEYPDATIQASYFDQSSFRALQGYAPRECKKIPKKPYWKVTLIAQEAALYLYLDSQTLKVECAHLEAGDECTKNDDCNDNDDSTKDICTGKPKKCVHELKTCRERNGDICEKDEYCEKAFIKAADTERCCPEKCVKPEEDPCKRIECDEHKKCVAGECVLKSCTEFGGTICPEKEYCVQGFIESSDSKRCCPGPCSETDPCTEITCAPHLKCVRGSCVLKTCAERGGQTCKENEKCSANYVNASDTQKCCTGTCLEPSVTPTPTDDECEGVECPEGMKCLGGSCVEKTCLEQNGTKCSEQEYCQGDYLLASDSLRCCSAQCALGQANCEDILRNFTMGVFQDFNDDYIHVEGKNSLQGVSMGLAFMGVLPTTQATQPIAVLGLFTQTGNMAGQFTVNSIAEEFTDLQNNTEKVLATWVKVTGIKTGEPMQVNLLVQGCLANEECQGGQCVEASECQSDSDCNDGLSYTLDKCTGNTCSNIFIEGTDCGNMNFTGLEGSDITSKCFSYAMIECVPARVRIVGDANVILSIIERNGDECTFNYLIEESLTQDIPGEGLDANCVYSISYVNAEHQEGMEMFTVLYLVFLVGGLVEGEEDACSGSLIDFMNTPCSEHCATQGFSFSKCIMNSDLDTYKLCALSEDGYIGKIKDCKIGREQGTCCCANSEGEMLK